MENRNLGNRDLDSREVEHRQKKKKKSQMSHILTIIGIVCITIAIYGLYDIYAEYKKGEDTYDNLEEDYVQIYEPTEGIIETQQEETEPATEEKIQGPWYELVSVDLAGLQAKYPDVVGWIFFENEKISYPVLQGVDNNQYLYTTYDGKSVKSGSIFMDYIASPDFSDTHTIIYGHNMQNLSMFGRLKYYRTKKDYYDTHMYFQIFRGNEILRYQIFSYQEIPVNSFLYHEEFTSAKKLAERLLAESIDGTYLDFQDSDHIITLSTCTADDDRRFVVNAVLVDTYSRN